MGTLEDRGKELLKEVEKFVTEVEYARLINEQWFIHFEDALNTLSIRDHNGNN